MDEYANASVPPRHPDQSIARHPIHQKAAAARRHKDTCRGSPASHISRSTTPGNNKPHCPAAEKKKKECSLAMNMQRAPEGGRAKKPHSSNGIPHALDATPTLFRHHSIALIPTQSQRTISASTPARGARHLPNPPAQIHPHRTAPQTPSQRPAQISARPRHAHAPAPYAPLAFALIVCVCVVCDGGGESGIGVWALRTVRVGIDPFLANPAVPPAILTLIGIIVSLAVQPPPAIPTSTNTRILRSIRLGLGRMAREIQGDIQNEVASGKSVQETKGDTPPACAASGSPTSEGSTLSESESEPEDEEEEDSSQVGHIKRGRRKPKSSLKGTAWVSGVTRVLIFG
ncbi:hypothetical protein C8J57DRAFT_1578960 [Mycena rebaudengoi]|nr:hypothetical protein C8J57DRAFT_1578960 [Mycena rebaudengoi]